MQINRFLDDLIYQTSNGVQIMRFFLAAFFLVFTLSWISGYFALYTPKISRPKNTYEYPKEYLLIFEEIENKINEKKFEGAALLCNEVILSATDKKVVAKSYYLRSKVYYHTQDFENAKKDLLYAKEIDFETFSTRATYSFIKSLREFVLYESELFSNRKKEYTEDLKPSVYYTIGLVVFSIFAFIFKAIVSFKKNKQKESAWNHY